MMPGPLTDTAGLVAEIDAEIAAAATMYHPSRFWDMLRDRNTTQIDGLALGNFKRTINNNYFQWLPGGYDDNQVRNLVRLWAGLPDNIPAEIAAASAAPGGWAGVEAFDGDDPFAHPRYRAFYTQFVGLLWSYVIGHDPIRLFERIEEPALGNPLPLFWEGHRISQDLANSIHEWSRWRQLSQGMLAPAVPRVLEIGAGYGRLAYVFAQAEPCKYVIVDIAPALAVAQWYLGTVLPDRRVFGFRPFSCYADIAAEFEAADICFLSANQLELLPDDVIDFTVSISSLHEMRHEQIAHYLDLVARKTRFGVYFKQWRQWTNPSDNIEVGRADFLLPAPWLLVLDQPHAVQDAFCELGFLRFLPTA